MRRARIVARTVLLAGTTGCTTVAPDTRIGPAERVTDLAAVAVMPLQHPSLAFEQSRSLTDTLTAALTARNPGARVVSPDQAAARLRFSQRLRDWAAFLIAYRDSNLVHGGTVIEVGRLLEVSGIVLLSVFPGNEVTPAELELSVFECTGGRLEWAGSSLLEPLGPLATRGGVARLRERLAELVDSLPALRQP